MKIAGIIFIRKRQLGEHPDIIIGHVSFVWFYFFNIVVRLTFRLNKLIEKRKKKVGEIK